ncbi:hypothetical protein ACHAXH_008405 [Discostella pseudostelligera]
MTMKSVLAIVLSLALNSSSFQLATRLSPVSRSTGVLNRTSASSCSSALWAQKRRRRKTPSTTSTSPDSIPTSSSDDELPDFDDEEDEEWEDSRKMIEPTAKVNKSSPMASSSTSSTSKTITPIKRGSGLNSNLAEQVGGNVEGLDEDVILEAMRGKAGGDSWLPPRSIQDTISDRSLEKFMDFDTMIERDGGGGDGAGRVDLPDFDEVISRRKQREAIQEGRVQDAAMLIDTEGMGKKAAKAAQRRAAAVQREAELEEQKSPFEDLNIFKLLENGAWVGIGLLVLWEFYINSPFFDRAAPLIPVVYDDALPPVM